MMPWVFGKLKPETMALTTNSCNSLQDVHLNHQPLPGNRGLRCWQCGILHWRGLAAGLRSSSKHSALVRTEKIGKSFQNDQTYQTCQGGGLFPPAEQEILTLWLLLMVTTTAKIEGLSNAWFGQPVGALILCYLSYIHAQRLRTCFLFSRELWSRQSDRHRL